MPASLLNPQKASTGRGRPWPLPVEALWGPFEGSGGFPPARSIMGSEQASISIKVPLKFSTNRINTGTYLYRIWLNTGLLSNLWCESSKLTLPGAKPLLNILWASYLGVQTLLEAKFGVCGVLITFDPGHFCMSKFHCPAVFMAWERQTTLKVQICTLKSGEKC